MKRRYLRYFTALFLTVIQILLFIPQASATGNYIDFAGYTWNLKDGYMGPGGNYWNPDRSAVFTDALGQLHLKVTNRNGRWYSSEVSLPSSLGYGTYEFEVASNITNIDPHLVAAMFLYQDDTHEFDIEFTNWNHEVTTNAQYVVQPFSPFTNINRFSVQPAPGNSIHQIIWRAEGVTFRSYQNGNLLREWVYSGQNNFEPGGERVHINFWMINAMPPSDSQEKELIIKNFRFFNNNNVIPAPLNISNNNNINGAQNISPSASSVSPGKPAYPQQTQNTPLPQWTPMSSETKSYRNNILPASHRMRRYN